MFSLLTSNKCLQRLRRKLWSPKPLSWIYTSEVMKQRKNENKILSLCLEIFRFCLIKVKSDLRFSIQKPKDYIYVPLLNVEGWASWCLIQTILNAFVSHLLSNDLQAIFGAWGSRFGMGETVCPLQQRTCSQIFQARHQIHIKDRVPEIYVYSNIQQC